jgi:hypothetical protein
MHKGFSGVPPVYLRCASGVHPVNLRCTGAGSLSGPAGLPKVCDHDANPECVSNGVTTCYPYRRGDNRGWCCLAENRR